MTVEKKKKSFRLGRRGIVFVALILLIFASLEIYTQTYVQVFTLPVVTEENAQSFMQQSARGSPDSFYKMDTYNFSSSGCSWLLVLETLKNTSVPENSAFVDIFKVKQNGSFFVLSTDLVILSVRALSQDAQSSGQFEAMFDGIFNNNNYTIARIDYFSPGPGTYDAVFNLTVGIYQRTLVGLIPKEQVTIPMNTTLCSAE